MVDLSVPFDPFISGETAFTKSFNAKFANGLQAYLGGDWRAAAETLQECHNMNSEDEPTRKILRVMGETSFVAPEDWPGYRELTEK